MTNTSLSNIKNKDALPSQVYCIYDGDDMQKDLVILRTFEPILGAGSKVGLPE